MTSELVSNSARQRYLLTNYLDETREAPPMEKVVQDVVAALEYFRV
uniref:Transposase n=1 Tax=Heterorhabditis bacteriophora TaxID=37862 RepID=A0A1I7WND1_HETBA